MTRIRSIFSLFLLGSTGLLTSCTDQIPPAPTSLPAVQRVIFTEMNELDPKDTTWVTTIHPDGTNRKRLFPGVMMNMPYNGKVVYITGEAYNMWRVEVGSVDGSSRTVAAEGPWSRNNDGVEDLDGFAVALSPTGKKVVYGTRSHNLVGDDARFLYSVDVDGKNKVRLSDNRASEAHIAVSPNGQRVAYYGRDRRLYVVNINGGQMIPLSENAGGHHDGFSWLEWSPDGNRIAFTGPADGNYYDQIWVVNADGSGLTRLTNDSLNYSWPVWSPDGSKIAYFTGSAKADIWIMNADGSNKTNLTEKSVDIASTFPQWSADGTKLLYTVYNGDNEEVPGILKVIEIGTGKITVLSTHAYKGFWVK